MDERNRAMHVGRMIAVARNKDAVERKKHKRATLKPWRELAVVWDELVKMHGHEKTTEQWGPAESLLARKLMKELTLEQATAHATHFVKSWCPSKQKAPSFRLFWVVRQQIAAELSGAVKPSMSKKELLDKSEFNETLAAQAPKFGWGDL